MPSRALMRCGTLGPHPPREGESATLNSDGSQRTCNDVDEASSNADTDWVMRNIDLAWLRPLAIAPAAVRESPNMTTLAPNCLVDRRECFNP